MEESLLTELAAVRSVCDSAALPDDARHTVAWCLDSLPDLYCRFCQTNDIRYGDEIRRLVQGLLVAVEDTTVRTSVTDQLQAMQVRLGIPRLQFASPKNVLPRKKTVG